MDRSEAREHLEMAERIVAASVRELSLSYSGPFFIVWGLFAGFVDVSAELALRHVWQATTAGWTDLGLLLIGIAFSTVYGMRVRPSTRSGLAFVQREFLRAMAVTFSMAFIAEWTGLFSEFGSSAIWSVACAIVLFYIWTHGNWRAFAGGVVVVVSMFVANYAPGVEGYVLAAGLFLGYAGFGVVEMMFA
jgi:hypothetical protein